MNFISRWVAVAFVCIGLSRLQFTGVFRGSNVERRRIPDTEKLQLFQRGKAPQLGAVSFLQE